MVVAAVEVGLRPVGVTPVGALDLAPPLRADDAARVGEVVGEEAGEHERPAEPLGLGHVAGGVDERGEAGVADGVGVDAERRQLDDVDRALAVAGYARCVDRPHPERPAVEGDHRLLTPGNVA